MSTVQQLGGVKLGSSDAEGIFVGSTQVAGKEFAFDWSKLYENLSYTWPTNSRTNSFPLVIANLSSNAVLLQRDGEVEEVAAGKIDWYTIGGQGDSLSEVQIFNEDANGNGTDKRILELYSTMLADGESVNTTVAYNWVAEKNEIIADTGNSVFKQFVYMCFIFDTE